MLPTAVKYGHIGIVSILLGYGAEVEAALPGAVTNNCRTTVQAYVKRDGLQKLVRGSYSSRKTKCCSRFWWSTYTVLSPPTRRREQ